MNNTTTLLYMIMFPLLFDFMFYLDLIIVSFSSLTRVFFVPSLILAVSSSIFFIFLMVVVVYSLRHIRLCDPMDCSQPGSSVHGVSQARILEWVAISFSRGSPNPGIEPRSPAWQADSLPAELQANPFSLPYFSLKFSAFQFPLAPRGVHLHFSGRPLLVAP